jgi:heme exporter protein A
VLRPTHGAGRIFGHDLVREAERIRGEIGVLGHSPGLYGDLTAKENLRFAARMLGKPVSPDEIREVLERVSLGGVRDERARGFSAGMQRRLALARLLIQRPRLVLLDEPYASFDVSGIELINTFLSDHQRGGGTAIVATHDLEKGSGVFGRIVELAAGRMVTREGPVAGSETGKTFEDGSEAASIGERVG